MGKRTRRGVQESLHPFLYRSIIKGCTGLQLEIDKNVYVIIIVCTQIYYLLCEVGRYI